MSTAAKKLIVPDSDQIEAIPATEMKNAHGVRLPKILKNKGVARVTRYNQTEYYVVSPKMFGSLMKSAQTPQRAKLSKLNAQYQDLVKRTQSPQSQTAFAALSKASSKELSAASTVKASD
ncbi:MAG: hypothetical protein ACSHX8_14620 [Opitutaceae bacterium]